MVRLGGAASAAYINVFRGLQTHFRRHGITLDWVLYADYDALVEAFIKREIDLAWNSPLAYVKIKHRLDKPCQVVAMRDVDVDFTTHFVTAPGSGITTMQDLKGKRVALGHRGSAQAGLLGYYFLQQLGFDPTQDLAACTFYEERPAGAPSDEQDVIQRVCQGEYDAGAVTQRTLDALQAAGTLQPESLRILWTSPGYSHCCFTAHSDMAPALVEQITQALLTITADVLYGRDTTAAARAAVLLMYAGVTDVRLLDGGFPAWRAAGYAIETVVHRSEPVTDFGITLPRHPEYLIGTTEARAFVAGHDVTLVSIRSWSEHIGATSGYRYIQSAGRIARDVWGHAGSAPLHMDHYRNVDNTMRNYHTIAAQWQAWGITPDKRLAFYCGTGWRASEAFFYAYVMGWVTIAVYDGGWGAWVQDPTNPVAVGVPSSCERTPRQRRALR